MREHLRLHLGTASDGWADDRGSDLKILLFRNQPQPGISTYSTFNMSNHILSLRNEKQVRQELIFSVYEKYETTKIAGSLLSFAEHVIETGKGLLRGEAIGPGNPFIAGTKLTGVYSSAPAFFQDSFHVYKDIIPPVVIVWLIPILTDEIEFIKSHGWKKYEDLLQGANCDFWDINRISILHSNRNH